MVVLGTDAPMLPVRLPTLLSVPTTAVGAVLPIPHVSTTAHTQKPIDTIATVPMAHRASLAHGCTPTGNPRIGPPSIRPPTRAPQHQRDGMAPRYGQALRWGLLAHGTALSGHCGAKVCYQVAHVIA